MNETKSKIETFNDILKNSSSKRSHWTFII